MASFIDDMKINTAITDNTKLDLGHQHITTTNFMQLQPILCKEMVPGERCDVNLMTFARLQPLAVPTFGRANIKERAFFVPMRTIFRGWNDFITDTPHVYSGASTISPTSKDGLVDDIIDLGGVNYPQVPTVSNNTLVSFIIGGTLTGPNWVITRTSDDNGSPITATNADIYVSDASGVGTYYRFTTEGKQVIKILESLGYKLVWDLRNEDVYSALPLLAIAKVYCDWYFPTQYVGTGSYVDIMGLLNYDGSAAVVLSFTDLSNIFGWITYVNFDSDYFVNAWDNPVAPARGVYSNFRIMDITTADPSGGGTGVNAGMYLYQHQTSSIPTTGHFAVSNAINNNGTPMTVANYGIGGGTGTFNSSYRVGMSVSDYQHKALTALTDYMKRHQLVGARAMDRYLARFGKQLNAEQLNRCNYIGSKLVPLQIGDVFSSSNNSATGTSGGLGQFAGKGMAMEQNFSFDWSTNEYGYLIVMSSLVPAASIYQGLDRKVMHIGRLDFWTPEFDNLGVQAISERELYNNYTYANLSNSASAYMGWDNTVFGFAPRYGEYKYSKDNVTGDIVLSSQQANTLSSAAENSWHLMRTFTDLDFKSGTTYSFTNMPHSRNFMQGTRDHYQFDRIFNYLPVDPATGKVTTFFYPDPITCIYDFQMVSFSPMKPLYETYEFEDKGKKVQEQSGGVKAN